MSMLRKPCWAMFCLPLLLLPVATGCGKGGLPMAEVEGVVKLNGQPLHDIQVEFWPESAGPRSFGVTDGQGRFKLMSDNGEKIGAAVGTHKVVLHDVGVFGGEFLGRAGEDADMAKGRKPRISSEYSDANNTTLSKDVVAGKKNEFELEVNPWKG